MTAQPATIAFAASQVSPTDRRSAEPSSRKGAPGRHELKGRYLLRRAAAFFVLTTASTALLALPYLVAAPDALQAQAGPSARLERAFAVARAIPPQSRLTAALAVAARKADRLTPQAGCSAQAWPHIDRRCLAGAGAGRSAEPVRSLTVEYRMGDSASALLRLPGRRLASQP